MAKRGIKGLQSQKGQPEYYEELKKRTALMLTPTATKQLDSWAEDLNISRSELVERLARGVYPVILDEEAASLGELLSC
ncbi:hypothetical protein H6F50_21305 [Coleofasciculus sp. FACHB-712]|uniref:hypothetical protein n=1 Tax=Coleofasciculus sp. FACHB-712 TaxID=2692789 RepID=UPI0016824201|nr:hypothetical protein [Coleofasciculus sp. FACHB-712]MBD1944864.1 hypothetical protein [Coleofasciculus sp. FACHB-712]